MRCPGGHQHVPIAGKFTKLSAVYVTEPAKHFAKAFSRALRRCRNSELLEKDPAGIQSVLCNDMLLTGAWKTQLQWHWRHSSHINVLESHAILALQRMLATQGGGRRSFALADSRVAKGSHAKGRSSALALRPSLMKTAAIQVAYGIYMSYGLAPTKLNIADCPTRDQELHPTDCHSIDFLPQERLAQIHSYGFSAVFARWIRLILLISSPDVALSPPTSQLPSWTFPFWLVESVVWTWLPAGFAAALGCFILWGLWQGLISFTLHPLKGSFISLHSIILSSLITFSSGQVITFHGPQLLPLGLLIFNCHGVSFEGLTAGEREKANRRASVQLQADRVLRPQTRNRRDVLLKDFEAWLLQQHSVTLAQLVDVREVDPENVSNFWSSMENTCFTMGSLMDDMLKQ